MRRSILLTLLLSLLGIAATWGFSPLPALNAVPSTSSTQVGVSIKVEVNAGEPIESAIRRFKREVNNSGHLMELRHRRYFETTQEKKKRKIKEARMRIRFERMKKRRMQQNLNLRKDNGTVNLSE